MRNGDTLVNEERGDMIKNLIINPWVVVGKGVAGGAADRDLIILTVDNKKKLTTLNTIIYTTGTFTDSFNTFSRIRIVSYSSRRGKMRCGRMTHRTPHTDLTHHTNDQTHQHHHHHHTDSFFFRFFRDLFLLHDAGCGRRSEATPIYHSKPHEMSTTLTIRYPKWLACL